MTGFAVVTVVLHFRKLFSILKKFISADHSAIPWLRLPHTLFGIAELRLPHTLFGIAELRLPTVPDIPIELVSNMESAKMNYCGMKMYAPVSSPETCIAPQPAPISTRYIGRTGNITIRCVYQEEPQRIEYMSKMYLIINHQSTIVNKLYERNFVKFEKSAPQIKYFKMRHPRRPKWRI